MTGPDELEDQVESTPFDFEAHRDAALKAYRTVRGGYEDFAKAVQAILRAGIVDRTLKVQAIDQRTKSEESFGDKASRPLDAEESGPKYSDPMTEIRDLAGCRVITFFLDDVQTVRQIVEDEFEVLEAQNRSSYLRGERKPGYESLHYVVRLRDSRTALPEYARFEGMVAEIQIRTILQHAWAEIEHDIQYKSVEALPADIGRRFQSLAGLIEIGDREFQAISDSHDRVRKAAAISIEAGRLSEVELTAETLKSYLDKELGPDGRMRDWTYEWTATYLKKMGFKTLDLLDECISPYNDDQLSRLVWGSRQGQLTRLELVLLAGIGPDKFKALHPYANSPYNPGWLERRVDRDVETLRNAGIPIGGEPPE